MNRSKTYKRLEITFVLFLAFLVAVSAHVRTATSQESEESLIYDLKNPDSARRKDAAKRLGDNKMQRATPDLVTAASDANPAVRREIAIALDKMLDMRALPAFVKLSADPEKDIRERCMVGIINLYIPQESGLVVSLNKMANFFNPWSDEWAEIVVEPGIKVDAGAIVALQDRLRDADEGLRLKAARALGILKATPAIPELLATLGRDQSHAIKFEIIRSLRKIGDPSVASELKPYLTYGDIKTRDEATFALGRLRSAEVVPELTRLYDRERALDPKLVDKAYCEVLLDAIAFIADPSSKDLFIKEKQNPEDMLRLHAFEGLARLADPSMATEISRDFLAEKNLRIKTAQAYALYQMGRKEYLDEVVKYLGNGKTNSEARMMLLELKPTQLPELCAQTKNQDANVREGLAEILGLIGDDSALTALKNLANDRRGQIAALANQAIRRINARSGTS
jgi:HEAT repeat protein